MSEETALRWDAQPPGTPAKTETRTERLARARRRKKRTRRALLIEWGVAIVLALVLAIGLRTVAFQAFFVPSGSMIPTLQIGDRILVDKAFFSASGLHEGDIVVFKTPVLARQRCLTEDGDLVKRVIGLPGQTISSSGNTVYVNGHKLSEPYLAPGEPLGQPINRVTIPAGQYFVMGDNRINSCDSRTWGTVPGSSMVGRVVAVLWRHGRPDLHIF